MAAVANRRGAPGHGRNIWTHEQRVCLHILWRQPEMSNLERARIFNKIFEGHLIACGLPNGLEKRTLEAQWREIGKTDKSTWNATWQGVCHPSSTEDSALRLKLQGEIADVLSASNIDHVATPSSPITPAVPDRRARYGLATPQSGSRKRRLATTPPPNVDAEDDEEYLPPVSKRKSDGRFPHTPPKRMRIGSPAVIVPTTSESVIKDLSVVVLPPQKTSPRKQRHHRPADSHGDLIVFERRRGPPLLLKPAAYAESQGPLVPVKDEIGHPKTPALLFREWNERSQGCNSENGFVSGRTSYALVEPKGPPPCEDVEFNDVALHLEPRTGVHSPFISFSNLLVWVCRKALKRAEPSSHISVIDASQLDPRSIYWVPPFYSELKRKKSFIQPFWNYQGSYEHLVWNEVPAQAMVKTFSLTELAQFAESDRDIRKVLRLDQLAASKTSAPDIKKSLKQANLTVSSRIARAIGEIVYFLGLDQTSSTEMLSRGVFEIVQGWAIKADGEAQDKARDFVDVFDQKAKGSVGPAEYFKLKYAFLNGLQWSCGELNAHLKGPGGYNKMKAAALNRGMRDPAAVIAKELDCIKLDIVMYEEKERLEHLRLGDAIADGGLANADEEAEDETQELSTLQLPRSGLLDEIQYE